jgi:hypothetical protein
MIGFIDAFCSIYLTHNQLQQLTINGSLHCHSHSQSLHTDYIRFRNTYIISTRTHRKYRFINCCIWSALHRKRSCPIVACVFVAAHFRLYLETGCLPRIFLRGNVFIETLPSSRSIRHNTMAYRVLVNSYLLTSNVCLSISYKTCS